ncbi:unnamed protein product, partial [Mesorhabditis belari]|uniref:Nascent polypeptide-associated complex subunit alpha-like UBA domain-containing protein n=1 Tax=Mesorhabditis belari TaxID=2138241 RepID=A0AAF3E9T0_9BILA
MADHEDFIEEHAEEEQKSDKHNWGAADLEKVTAMSSNEDEKEVEVLGNLERLIEAPMEKKATIKLKKEDVQTIIDELLVSKLRAEKELLNAEGDLKKALRSLTGF